MTGRTRFRIATAISFAGLCLGMSGLPDGMARAGAQATPSPSVEEAAMVAKGRAVFISVGCSSCHGTAGQGGVGPMSGPRIVKIGLNLGALTYFVRNPVRLMPSYSESQLGAKELAAIQAYLDSLPEPPTAGDVPALRAHQ